MRVLFVCSGNICRSPMAAAYLQHRMAELGERGVFVESAGTLGIEGAPPSAEAVEAMRDLDIDITAHRSRALTPEDLSSADVVIAMTQGHLAAMARWPEGADRRYLIRAFEHGPVPREDPPDLDDPIGRGVEFYRETLSTITKCLDHLSAWLD